MVAGVLVVVDEQVVRVAVLLPPLGRDVVGCPSLDLAGERVRRSAYVGEAVVGVDPDVDVQPLAAAGLGVTDGAELIEHLVDDAGHPLHLREVGQRPGVEVDPPLVGLLGVGAPAVPGVSSRLTGPSVDDDDLVRLVGR